MKLTEEIKLLSHSMLGTNDIDRAKNFYEQIFSLIQGSQLYRSERMVFWEFEQSEGKFAIAKPFDDKPATAGNGTMVALKLKSPELVSQVYAKAIEIGATCEGGPGKRGDGEFFAAYFRDLDQNKIAIFCQ
ncbi:VOC family protein [Aliikangiella maris]|uniref:VOC family protein n=2 Tax=Aliikangiella maris TaxID=3162458 RepID=A0ABV3MR37_9GAMM